MTDHDHVKHDHESDTERGTAASCLRRGHWIAIGFIAIAAVYLITEHRAHVLGVLPFLLLLACPLMHFFMHGGHGGHERTKS